LFHVLGDNADDVIAINITKLELSYHVSLQLRLRIVQNTECKTPVQFLIIAQSPHTHATLNTPLCRAIFFHVN